MWTQSLTNKKAVVTGASSGIGLAVARLFAREGAQVAIVDKDLEKAGQAVLSLEGQGCCFAADISRAEQVEAVSASIAAQWGGVDILVNNAGIFIPGGVEETSAEQWQAVLSTNLTGSFLCIKYLLPLLEKQGGSIINIASEAGLVGIAGQVAYNVSKAGVISLTRSCAVDFASRNVRVNCVCPGRVLTPLVQEIIHNSPDPAMQKHKLESDRPMGRMGQPDEIAAAVLLFASDACKYATGSVMQVDGGYTALQLATNPDIQN